jgi:hypothetical protein
MILSRRPNDLKPSRRSLMVPGLVMVLALVWPGATAAAGDSRSAAPPAWQATAPTGEFSINLYQDGDFASQRTAYWCIGASMQMMLNIVGLTDDDSRAGQERYMRLARSSGPSLQQVDHGQTDLAGGALRGAGSSGWARGMVQLGAGGYRQQAVDGYDAALRAAAVALRRTGRPTGLIVWRGAHSWVMSGFTASADPLVDPDFRVTGVYIQDPWYPRVSSIWGPGQKPNAWISISALKADFLPRRGGGYHVEQAGKYVLVLPFDPDRRAARWQTL